MTTPKILIIDDNPDIGQALQIAERYPSLYEPGRRFR